MSGVDLKNQGIRREQLKKLSGLLFGGLLLILAFFLLFYDLAEDMLNQELAHFDKSAASAVLAWRSPSLTTAFKLVTYMGSWAAILLVTALTIFYLLYYRRHKWDAIMFGIAIGGASIMNYLLKVAFGRLRPDPPALVSASGFSFPSGHSMDSLVLYGMILYLLWINIKPSLASSLVSLLLVILIISIGLSRIYLGVHYPSDVLAGYCAGGFWLVTCILALHTIRHLKQAS